MKKVSPLLAVFAGMLIQLFPQICAFAESADGEIAKPLAGASAFVGEFRSSETENRDALYWFEKGALYATYGNPSAAVESFRKAIAADPAYAEAYFNLGVVYAEMENYAEAIATIDKAIASRPGTGRYYYGRGWIYLRSGQSEQAMADIRMAAKLGDADASIYLDRIAHRKL